MSCYRVKSAIVLRAVCAILICGFLLSGVGVSSYAITDATNKSTLAPHLATQSQGSSLLRNEWIVVEIGKLIYPILKLTQEGKLHNPTAILIPHIKKNVDMAEPRGFDVDGIKEVREGQAITGFSLPVTRNDKTAYKLVYNLQGGDTAIAISNTTNLYVKVVEEIFPSKNVYLPSETAFRKSLNSASDGVSGNVLSLSEFKTRTNRAVYGRSNFMRALDGLGEYLVGDIWSDEGFVVLASNTEEIQELFSNPSVAEIQTDYRGVRWSIPTLARLFNSRECFEVKRGDMSDEIVVLKNSKLYIGTFPNTYTLVNVANITSEDKILDPFAGTGGYLIIAGYKSPKQVIGVDVAYNRDSKPIEYASEHTMKVWESTFDYLPEPIRPKFTQPTFIAGDATELRGIADGSITKIISAPPYGIATSEYFNINPERAFQLFLDSLNAAKRVLSEGGSAYYLIPKMWLDKQSFICNTANRLGFSISIVKEELLGDMVIIKFSKISGNLPISIHNSVSGKTKNTITAPAVVSPESERIHATNFQDTLTYIQAEEDERARQAKEEPRPTIVALGTSWIEGYKRNEDGRSFRHLQGKDLNELITSIRSYCESKGIPFIVDDDDKLLTRINAERVKDGKAGAKVVVLAGENTVKSDEFAQLRNDEKNAVVVGVNSEQLTPDSYIRLMEMLTLALKLSSGLEVSLNNANITITKDNERHICIFLPHAEPMNYERLKVIYEVQKFA